MRVLLVAFTVCEMFLLQASDPVVETRSTAELIAYVKSKCEHTMHGIDYLLYSAQRPKQLWILFNGATPGKYTMWSWFWRDDENWDDVAYLFLKDDDIRWYLGSVESPKTPIYLDIITNVMQSLGLEPSQVCTIGHSMGGYAALYYGLLLQACCIYTFRPQVTWDAAVTYYSVKKLHDVWVDIDTLVREQPTTPRLYLQYGEFMPDKLSGKALIDAYTERHGIMIVERTDHPEHLGFHPTKEQIEKTIAFLMEY
jgi:hypothetical protein